MTVRIFHRSSSIARAFVELLPDGEQIMPEAELIADRYLVCTGYLAGERVGDMSQSQLARTSQANFTDIVAVCDMIFDANPDARVCVIGSESGYAGSYDMAYAGAKAAMHMYIKTKRLQHPGQQLVGIAPTVIIDSGMTQRRDDLEQLIARGAARRRGEWLTAMDVARLAHFALYVDRGNLCNTVLRMTGGNI